LPLGPPEIPEPHQPRDMNHDAAIAIRDMDLQGNVLRSATCYVETTLSIDEARQPCEFELA
jgi:hypothetical protein